MPRTMEKVVPVKITTDEMNCYATIQRSLIGAITAATRIAQSDKAPKERRNEAKKLINMFKQQKTLASTRYDEVLNSMLEEIK